MKYISLFIGVLIFLNSCNSGTAKKSNIQTDDSKENGILDHRRLAFQNNEFISIYDFSKRKTKDLTQGFDPCISPDGKWIAFTQATTPGKDYSRIIRLIHTENSTIKDLEINNTNHYGAIWSPTGEHLAFSIMNNQWQIGLIKPNSSNFKIISSDSDIGLHAPTWTPDGKYIFAHNLDILYKFDTNGDLIKKLDLKQLFGDKFYFSSSTRFCLTSNDKKLIFAAGIDEYIQGLNEPLSAIFSYDFDTKKN
ncbi:MAG: TolB family protein [Flavobacteriaceae bacterium]